MSHIHISIFSICNYAYVKHMNLFRSENQAAVSKTSLCGCTEQIQRLYLLFLAVQVAPEVLWVPEEPVLVSQEDQRCQENRGRRGNQLLLLYLGIQVRQRVREDLDLPLCLKQCGR